MRKQLLLVLALAGAWLSLGAQRTITGLITDHKGTHVAGAKVVVAGTRVGTHADAQGRYKIDVWSGAKSLQFTHPAYKAISRTIGLSDTINVQFTSPLAPLSTAYTNPMDSLETQYWASPIDILTVDDIAQAPYTRLDQLLQARMPGLHILQYSAQAASPGQIRHRGPFSASSTTTPLILIDGVRVDASHHSPELGIINTSALADLPLDAIAQIAFIPASVAGAQYGTAAAGGVLDIRTRRAPQQGKSQLSYQAVAGIQTLENRFLHFSNSDDLLYESGRLQLHRFTWARHSDKMTFHFGGSYYADNGIKAPEEQARTSFRLGLSAALNPKLDYTASAAYQGAQYQFGYTGNSSLHLLALAEGGYWGELDDYTSLQLDSLRTAIDQQYAATDRSARVQRFHTAHGLQWRPHKSITATLRIGLDQGHSQQTDVFSNALAIAANLAAPGTFDRGILQLADRQFSLFSQELILRHEAQLGTFTLRSSLGGQYSRHTENQMRIQASGLVEGYRDLNHTTAQYRVAYLDDWRYGGFYLAEQISIQERFFGDAALRWEAHNDYGGLAAASPIYRLGLSYVVVPASKSSQAAVSDLRLHAGAGQALSFPLRYNRQSVVNTYELLPEPLLAQASPDSLMLQGEKSTTYEVGFSGSFFQEHLQIGFTYYSQQTQDAILPVPAATSAESYALLRNGGIIRNTGTALRLRLQLVQKEKFALAINGSWIRNQNEVDELAGSPPYPLGGLTLAGAYVQNGQALGYWQGSIPTFTTTGELSTYTTNSYLGDPNPDGYGTLGLDLRWKRWSCYLNGDYQYGAQGVDGMAALRYQNGLSQTEDLAPGLPLSQLGQVWIADTDYLKIRQVGLNYRIALPQNLIRQLDLGIMLRQAFVWATSDFDPEVSLLNQGRQGSLGVPGLALGGESLPRQLIFHAKATF